MVSVPPALRMPNQVRFIIVINDPTICKAWFSVLGLPRPEPESDAAEKTVLAGLLGQCGTIYSLSGNNNAGGKGHVLT